MKDKTLIMRLLVLVTLIYMCPINIFMDLIIYLIAL